MVFAYDDVMISIADPNIFVAIDPVEVIFVDYYGVLNISGPVCPDINIPYIQTS